METGESIAEIRGARCLHARDVPPSFARRRHVHAAARALAVFVAVIAVVVVIADRWIEAFRAEFDAEGNGREFKWDILF